MTGSLPPDPTAGASTLEPRSSSGRWIWLAMSVAVASFVVIALVAVLKAGDIDDDVLVALVAALASAVVSIVVSGLAHLDRIRNDAERARIRQREDEERRELRYEDLVLKSLDYFTGKSQRRSVGVAIVEGGWDHAPHLRPVFVPLLVNQAIYLLEESEQGDASHELQNLERIMSLVIESRRHDDLGGEHAYAPLVRSIDRRLDPGRTGDGLAVGDTRLEAWRTALAGTGT